MDNKTFGEYRKTIELLEEKILLELEEEIKCSRCLDEIRGYEISQAIVKAAVENFINPLEDIEKERYSRKAKQIIGCYSLLAGVGMYMQNKIVSESIFWGIIVVAISVLAGKWKYRENLSTDTWEWKVPE